MEDHHVDRLGMHAQRCAQSTSTNRSIGLIRPGRRPTNVGHPDQRGSLETLAFYGKIKTLVFVASRDAPCAQPSPAAPIGAQRRTGRTARARTRGPASFRRDLKTKTGLVRRSGGHSARETPDPFPNSAVKPCRADGTAAQAVGE